MKLMHIRQSKLYILIHFDNHAGRLVSVLNIEYFHKYKNLENKTIVMSCLPDMYFRSRASKELIL